MWTHPGDVLRTVLTVSVLYALASRSAWSQLPRAPKYADALAGLTSDVWPLQDNPLLRDLSLAAGSRSGDRTGVNASSLTVVSSLPAAAVMALPVLSGLRGIVARGAFRGNAGDSWFAEQVWKREEGPGKEPPEGEEMASGGGDLEGEDRRAQALEPLTETLDVEVFGALFPAVGVSLAWVWVTVGGLRAACGCSTRLERLSLALAWGGVYYFSQQDDYQHHHYLALVLCLLVFLGADTAASVRLSLMGIGAPVLRTSVSLLYLWTAVAKLNPNWLGGETLRHTGSPWFVSLVEDTVGRHVFLGASELWAALAVTTVILELFLVIGFQIPKLWPPVLVTGIGMHVGFEQCGISIGHFSYLMMALYLLVLPTSVIRYLPGQRQLLGLLGMSPGPFLGLSDLSEKRALAIALPLSFIASVSTGYLMVSGRDGIIGFAASVSVSAMIGWHVISLLGETSISAQTRRCWMHLFACVLIVMMTRTSPDLRAADVEWSHYFARHGSMKSAIDRYEALLSVDPDFADGYAELSVFYAVPGDTQNLEKTRENNLHVLTELNPEHLRALSGHVQFLAQMGEDSGSLCDWVSKLEAVALRKTYQVCDGSECENEQRYAARMAMPLVQQIQDQHCGQR